jgi:uncharacterized membrane protein
LPDPNQKDNPDKIVPPVMSNIEMVARLEEDMLRQRTTVDRVGDAIADFAGSMKFILAHAIAFALWILVNSRVLPGLPPFDPYPYVFLTMVVSLEGVLVATFVLMKQNRMAKRAEHREHLDLQINLLAEKEATKMLDLQRKICRHLGIPDADQDKEVQELSKETALDRLAETLRDKLPER